MVASSYASPLACAISRWVVARLARSRPTALNGRLARLRASFCSCLIWLLICSSVRMAVKVFCTKLEGSNTMRWARAGCAAPKARTLAAATAASLVVKTVRSCMAVLLGVDGIGNSRWR